MWTHGSNLDCVWQFLCACLGRSLCQWEPDTMALIQTCQIQAIMTVPKRLFFSNTCQTAILPHVGTLNSARSACSTFQSAFIRAKASVVLWNSFLGWPWANLALLAQRQKKHWCPVSTFSYFRGKAFIGKPATQRRQIHQKTKMINGVLLQTPGTLLRRVLQGNEASLCHVEPTPWHWCKHVGLRGFGTVPHTTGWLCTADKLRGLAMMDQSSKSRTQNNLQASIPNPPNAIDCPPLVFRAFKIQIPINITMRANHVEGKQPHLQKAWFLEIVTMRGWEGKLTKTNWMDGSMMDGL